MGEGGGEGGRGKGKKRIPSTKLFPWEVQMR